jgi:hypothetical protein
MAFPFLALPSFVSHARGRQCYLIMLARSGGDPTSNAAELVCK